MSELADRIKAYLSDHPGNGGHSDAAGGNAWELLDEAMWEVKAAADRIEALEAALREVAIYNANITKTIREAIDQKDAGIGCGKSVIEPWAPEQGK